MGPGGFPGRRGAAAPGLIDDGYEELAGAGTHAAAAGALPPIHRDPFDRMLVAVDRGQVEGMLLVTSDPVLRRYPWAVRVV